MYQVHTNYGAGIFTNENDAITALWLIGSYHDVKINRKEVKKELERNSFYEDLHCMSLFIIKAEK